MIAFLKLFRLMDKYLCFSKKKKNSSTGPMTSCHVITAQNIFFTHLNFTLLSQYEQELIINLPVTMTTYLKYPSILPMCPKVEKIFVESILVVI